MYPCTPVNPIIGMTFLQPDSVYRAGEDIFDAPKLRLVRASSTP